MGEHAPGLGPPRGEMESKHQPQKSDVVCKRQLEERCIAVHGSSRRGRVGGGRLARRGCSGGSREGDERRQTDPTRLLYRFRIQHACAATPPVVRSQYARSRPHRRRKAPAIPAAPQRGRLRETRNVAAACRHTCVCRDTSITAHTHEIRGDAQCEQRRSVILGSVGILPGHQ